MASWILSFTITMKFMIVRRWKVVSSSRVLSIGTWCYDLHASRYSSIASLATLSASRYTSTKIPSCKERTMTSVLGQPLQPCSESGMPVTGYTRDGVCSLHSGDTGSHHVCLRRLGETSFCETTGQPNWCESKDNWCVCEWAFDTAVAKAGCDSFQIKCDSTNQLSLDHYERAGKTDAASCIREQCHLR